MSRRDAAGGCFWLISLFSGDVGGALRILRDCQGFYPVYGTMDKCPSCGYQSKHFSKPIRRFMSSSVVVISDCEFETTVLQTDQPVLVYFWAPWCGPCRLMSPMMESVASQYGDRLKIVKMEVDANPEAVARYKVEGVPALILFREGQPVEAIEGVVNKQRIEGFLDAHLPQPA